MAVPDGGSAPSTSPHLPADHTFVVQFQAPPSHDEQAAGRVEHLVSGDWTRFEDWSELEGFVAKVLWAGREPQA